jgi:hypothetical protein
MRAPRPRAAKNRRRPTVSRLSAVAIAAVKHPKSNALPMSARRLPIRSPAMPPIAPPIIIPTIPLASTGANDARGSAQSFMIAGRETGSS